MSFLILRNPAGEIHFQAVRKVLTIEAKGEGEEVCLDIFMPNLAGVNLLLARTCGAGIVRRTAKGFMGCSTTLSIPLRRSLDSRPEMGRRSEE